MIPKPAQLPLKQNYCSCCHKASCACSQWKVPCSFKQGHSTSIHPAPSMLGGTHAITPEPFACLQVLGPQRVSVCDAEHGEGRVVGVGRYPPPCHFLDPRPPPGSVVEVWPGHSHGVWTGGAGELPFSPWFRPVAVVYVCVCTVYVVHALLLHCMWQGRWQGRCFGCTFHMFFWCPKNQ